MNAEAANDFETASHFLIGLGGEFYVLQDKLKTLVDARFVKLAPPQLTLVHWRAIVNTVMNLRVIKHGEFLN
jgi:hypothetical protein